VNEGSRGFGTLGKTSLAKPRVRVDHAGVEPTTTPARVLVLDDDYGIRTLLQMNFDIDARFELVAAAGTAAELRIELARAEPATIDAILIDVTLPDANGVELISELRTVVPDARLALFTGWSDPRLNEQALSAGADAVYQKDGDPAKLLNCLAELIAASSHDD
jgi:DNA-binding NarL/FixJ family response regulator